MPGVEKGDLARDEHRAEQRGTTAAVDGLARELDRALGVLERTLALTRIPEVDREPAEDERAQRVVGRSQRRQRLLEPVDVDVARVGGLEPQVAEPERGVRELRGVTPLRALRHRDERRHRIGAEVELRAPTLEEDVAAEPLVAVAAELERLVELLDRRAVRELARRLPAGLDRAVEAGADVLISQPGARQTPRLLVMAGQLGGIRLLRRRQRASHAKVQAQPARHRQPLVQRGAHAIVREREDLARRLDDQPRRAAFFDHVQQRVLTGPHERLERAQREARADHRADGERLHRRRGQRPHAAQDHLGDAGGEAEGVERSRVEGAGTLRLVQRAQGLLDEQRVALGRAMELRTNSCVAPPLLSRASTSARVSASSRPLRASLTIRSSARRALSGWSSATSSSR